MASGKKEMIINTQERAVSTDVNRLQKFSNADEAEFARYYMNVSADDDQHAGVITEHNSTESPLRAEILGGLMVHPQIGSYNLLVDAGAIQAIAPDGAADDSIYKRINDPGVTVLGSLFIGTNTSGSTRIDVIEVSVGSTIVETDNRDIYNTTTGLFTPTTVNKAVKGSVTGGSIRVRQGTAGAGMPARQAGWLPICVASVPNLAASCNDCTFWDVRPLVAARLFAPAALSVDYPEVVRSNFVIDDSAGAGNLIMSGQSVSSICPTALITNAASVRAGGTLRRGTPGTDADNVNLADAANWASGFTYAGTGFAYVYLLMPFTLPGWARYTDFGSGARLPRSPRGIICVSATPPNHLTGRPSSGINLPDSTGLQGSTTAGICIGHVCIAAGTPLGGLADGRVHWMRGPAVGGGGSVGVGVAGTSVTNNSCTFALTEGTTHPANAKALYVQVALAYSVTVASPSFGYANCSFLKIMTPGGVVLAAVPVGSIPLYGNIGQTAQFISGMVRVPIFSQYPANTAGSVKNLIWLYNLNNMIGTFTVGSSSLIINGWDIGS